MAKNKFKNFYAPGIYHRLLVKFVTQKWLGRYVNDNKTIAAYIHEDGEVYVTKEAKTEPRLHNFCHELSHHIWDTLEALPEEDRCDALGAYLIRFAEAWPEIKKNLKTDEE